MVEKVLDLTGVRGACGDLAVVLDSAAEELKSGDVLVVKVPSDFKEELEEAIDAVSDKFELLESKVEDGIAIFKLRRR